VIPTFFRTITTEGVCPMQYLLLYIRGEGASTRAEPSCHPVGDGTWCPCMQGLSRGWREGESMSQSDAPLAFLLSQSDIPPA
jgi:hypothetical protein